MNKEIFTKKGNWNTIPGSDPDISITIELDSYPRESQYINVVSIHGQKRQVVKEISLSLEELINLRDSLSAAINNFQNVKHKKI